MERFEALEFLMLSGKANLSEIKKAFRTLSFKFHPDHGGTPSEFMKLTQAYDIATQYCTVGKDWQEEQSQNLQEWKNTFKKLWREAYEKSQNQKPDDGLHFNTCIENFRRAYVYPPEIWFSHALLGQKENMRSYYREHLMRIAPNKKMAESYSKKYWELEFEEKWVFYLPAKVELLQTSP